MVAAPHDSARESLQSHKGSSVTGRRGKVTLAREVASIPQGFVCNPRFNAALRVSAAASIPQGFVCNRAQFVALTPLYWCSGLSVSVDPQYPQNPRRSMKSAVDRPSNEPQFERPNGCESGTVSLRRPERWV